MASLKTADYRSILALLDNVGRAPDLDGFRQTALTGLAHLIPSDQVGYNEIDFRAGSAIVIDIPEPFVWDETERLLAEYAYEHPVISHYQNTGDLRALMISDFLSRRDFHRLTIYNECYARLGAEDQLAIGLPGPPWMVIGIAFNRSKNFTERDREILDLVAPHLMHQYRNAIERSRLTAAIQTAFATYPRGVILFELDGSVGLVTNKAQQYLADFFGDSGSRLPDELDHWLELRRMPQVEDLDTNPIFYKKVGEKSLRATHLPSESLDHPEMLVIDVRPREIDAQALLRLGLTPRQIEVLHAVSRGSSNRDIAERMDVSMATVKKHLEEIYSRLGVSSRAEAVAIAFDANWDLG
ncbi:MAG TPA: LuxR C-terminal-related transcriptional regulator [Actinomycetota bacterium]|nr:LuxR C-terminal-related transcriptional regulator [Actinomycetota bacterium]